MLWCPGAYLLAAVCSANNSVKNISSSSEINLFFETIIPAQWRLELLIIYCSKMIYSIFCSINTVYYMAPFATMILALPAMLLEGGGVINWFYTHDSIVSALIIILGSGVLAFCLNFSIFYVIHSTTAVTFNVAGNLKVRHDYILGHVLLPTPSARH